MMLMDMEPENEKIYFNLGMLSMDDNEFEQAKAWFDRAIEVLLSLLPFYWLTFCSHSDFQCLLNYRTSRLCQNCSSLVQVSQPRIFELIVAGFSQAVPTSYEPLFRMFISTVLSSNISCSLFFYFLFFFVNRLCLQCFDTVGWASGRACSLYKIEWWGAGMVVCLEWGANDLHMVQLMPLPLDHFLLH